MIPANLDYVSMIEDLNGFGWTDYRLDAILGYSAGYCAQVRCRNIKDPTYPKASRLYNFWFAERVARHMPVPPDSARST